MEPSNADAALQKALDTARQIRILGALDSPQTKRIAQALQILTVAPKGDRHKKYKLFLADVWCESGRSAVLVTVLGLGQGRITDLRSAERSRLSQLIKDNKAILTHQTIDALAAASGIPRTIDDFPPTRSGFDSSETEVHPVLEDTDHGESIATDEIQSDFTAGPQAHSNVAVTTDHRIVENATIEGTREVFGSNLCDTIRRVNIDGKIKAAVTIMLPKWGGVVDCLISLDIREEEVAKLASALFKTNVSWVGRNLHVVLQNGLSIILSTPDAEVTLKGATNEAITDVFGPEIREAVNESPIRKREWEAGQQSTHCVSMILTKAGAIINLSVGLEGGLAIQSRLHPASPPSDDRHI